MSEFFKKLFGGSRPQNKQNTVDHPIGQKQNDTFEDAMSEIAADAVDKFGVQAGNGLDLTPGSLAAVESLLSELSERSGDLTVEQESEIVQLLGAYILEVGRREFGGKYSWYEAGNEPVLVVGQPVFSIAMIPGDKVRGRLRGDEADNIPFFYDGFAERARRAEPGDAITYV
ncbi:MAG: hypothetical protein ABJA67_02845 [Chthonomonadales bacterium]